MKQSNWEQKFIFSFFFWKKTAFHVFIIYHYILPILLLLNISLSLSLSFSLSLFLTIPVCKTSYTVEPARLKWRKVKKNRVQSNYGSEMVLARCAIELEKKKKKQLARSAVRASSAASPCAWMFWMFSSMRMNKVKEWVWW